MKILSIIGILLFSLILLVTINVMDSLGAIIEVIDAIGKLASVFDMDEEVTEIGDSIGAAVGGMLIGSIFGLTLSIVGVVASQKSKKNPAKKSDMEQLQQLAVLKQAGALTEEEFEAKKREILNY